MVGLGTLFIISAPSGAGKTSLVHALIKQLPMLTVSVSHTTRAPRAGEVDGQNYFFVDESAFITLRNQGSFLEHAQVFKNWYGTSKLWVIEQLQKGIDVILEIDWQGAARVKEQMECVSVFVLPPSRETLLTRLQGRQKDSAEVIKERMSQASNEVSHYAAYDYLVVNDDFETALSELACIIRTQRLKMRFQKDRHAKLLASLIEQD